MKSSKFTLRPMVYNPELDDNDGTVRVKLTPSDFN